MVSFILTCGRRPRTTETSLSRGQAVTRAAVLESAEAEDVGADRFQTVCEEGAQCCSEVQDAAHLRQETAKAEDEEAQVQKAHEANA